MKEDRSLSYLADWQERYQEVIATPEQAVSRIRPGQRIFIGTGCAQPQELVRALVLRAGWLSDTEIVHLLTIGDAPYAERELAHCFTINSFFIAENVRNIIQEGLGDYTPVSLFDIPRLFKSGRLPLDVALIQVSPPDEQEMCSLGISVDIVSSAAENAGLVIAQVNPQMPRTQGDSTLSVHDLDILVPADVPLLEVEPPEPTEVSRKIGQHVASLLEDGSTVELGIGNIPHALVEFLKTKKDLGIHTEMFTDSIIELIDSGAISGSRKSSNKGKIVASFCMGTRRLYEYIDGNPLFSFKPTEYVNDPYVIGKQNRMVSINVALEVDLTGQVCADSLGTKFFSGIGGQTNFNIGAGRSPGGRAIITLPSTAKDGKISRIVSRLSPGAGVVTTRGDVHYVVTEYGVAYLYGKSVKERSLALISIAHPDFRAELLKDAIEIKYLRSELTEMGGKIHVEPQELKTSMLLDDGTQVNFRPVHLTDEHRMKDLFYALSKETIYSRWMSHLKRIPQEEIQNYVYIDHRNQVAIVGTLPESHGEDIIAIGGYYLDPKTNRAEVAFTVRDKWQKRGIGTFLLNYLIRIARRNGIAGFTAEVLRQNKAMQTVFNNSDCKVSSHLVEGVYGFELEFE
ncbi:MAG: GNAT family N-acetyltransferase [Deltaproteobacteria bacterium]|nr:GNAT family N-acetyltransferase [Deltaproteobacteria bacterium]